jgi:CMP-N,N'-diacetyllegionaminic acid synthase
VQSTEILGVIPARGGSKGIPGKNLADCAGSPLIAHTCRAARGARLLTRTIVSTDDERIAAVVKELGVEAPFLRPSELSTDQAPMLGVVRHAVEWARGVGMNPGAVALLQPTSPLRQACHIDEAIELFHASGASSVVSVVDVPHQFTPDSLMRRSGPFLELYQATDGPVRRQEKPAFVARNGPAVLVVSVASLRGETLYPAPVVGYSMSREESIDIDDAFDLRMADLLLRERR